MVTDKEVVELRFINVAQIAILWNYAGLCFLVIHFDIVSNRETMHFYN